MENAKTTLSITIENGKLLIEPSIRLSNEEFRAIRSLGFRWSYNADAFIFDAIDSGYLRVNRLIQSTDGNAKSHYAHDLTDCTVELSEEVKSNLDDYNQRKKDEEARAKAEKEAKEAHADANRLKRFEACKKAIARAKNGFGSSIYRLSEYNYNLLDAGLTKAVKVSELCERFGLEDPLKEEYLEITIDYYNNYYNGDVSLQVTVSGYTSSHTDGFWCGGSHHYSQRISLGKVDKRKVDQLIKVSEAFNDDVLKMVMEDYCDRYNGIDNGSAIYDIGSAIGCAGLLETRNQRTDEKLKENLAY